MAPELDGDEAGSGELESVRAIHPRLLEVPVHDDQATVSLLDPHGAAPNLRLHARACGLDAAGSVDLQPVRIVSDRPLGVVQHRVLLRRAVVRELEPVAHIVSEATELDGREDLLRLSGGRQEVPQVDAVTRRALNAAHSHATLVRRAPRVAEPLDVRIAVRALQSPVGTPVGECPVVERLVGGNGAPLQAKEVESGDDLAVLQLPDGGECRSR